MISLRRGSGLVKGLLLLLFSLSLPFRAAELRTLTNQSGKTIEATILAVEDGKVSIRDESGRTFEIPLATLSEDNQRELAAWSPPPTTPLSEGGVTAEQINKAIGQELFAEGSLWSNRPEEVAARLNWPRESKTAIGESYRAYPKVDERFLGARPYSAALYGEDEEVTSISIVFANKGDSMGSAGSGESHFIKGEPVPGGIEGVRMIMKNDAELIGNALTELLGEPKKQRFGEGESRVMVERWDWVDHSFLLSHVPDEYVSLSVQMTEVADKRGNTSRVPDSVIRERSRGFVETRDNGDVVITNIPMVDQGPKGYCVPATVERCMRFMGIQADMYLLAMAGETKAGGGTSPARLLNNIGSDIKRKGRSFDILQGDLKLRNIKRSIDSGIPIMWALQSTKEFNELATERTKTRAESWDSHKSQILSGATAQLPPDPTRGHVVIIIGYNEETQEIAFSDSWGERYLERWISLAEAEQVSSKRMYVIGL